MIRNPCRSEQAAANQASPNTTSDNNDFPNLCAKHNSRLSELDSAALEAFNVFRETVRLSDVRGRLRSGQTEEEPFHR
jgi:hypothetical protein